MMGRQRLLACLVLPFAGARLTGEHGFDPPPRTITCEQPVQRAVVEFPAHILREKPEWEMHSGYINVTANDYLFYWHFAAQTAISDAPIILCGLFRQPALTVRPAEFTHRRLRSAWRCTQVE